MAGRVDAHNGSGCQEPPRPTRWALLVSKLGTRNVRFPPDTVAELDEKQRPDNNRIGTNTFLNQYYALTPDLDSMLLAWARKIVLQHNPPLSGHFHSRFACPLSAISGY